MFRRIVNHEVLRDGAYGLSSLSEKAIESNHSVADVITNAALSIRLFKEPECWSGQGSNSQPPAPWCDTQPTELTGQRWLSRERLRNAQILITPVQSVQKNGFGWLNRQILLPSCRFRRGCLSCPRPSSLMHSAMWLFFVVRPSINCAKLSRNLSWISQICMKRYVQKCNHDKMHAVFNKRSKCPLLFLVNFIITSGK